MRQGLVFLLLFVSTGVTTGCDALLGESISDAGAALPTSVSMDPESFLTPPTQPCSPSLPCPGGQSCVNSMCIGGFPVACGDTTGSMQGYVATITDITDSEAPFPLPSSPPVSCTQSVYFDYVGLTRVYTGVIDGYTQPASALTPACSIAGPSSSCAADSDCPVTLGCGGACQVTTWAAENTTGCLANPCKVDLTCVAGRNGCSANNVADYVTCISDCATGCPGPNCISAKAAVQQCLQNNANCLLPDFSKVRNSCAATPAPGAGIKACTCEYNAAGGDRHMYDSQGNLVLPRWTTTASQPCSAGFTQSYENTPLINCGPLEDNAPDSTPTAIQLDPTSGLTGSGLACYEPAVAGSDAGPTGTVTSFDVTPGDPSLMPYIGVPCSTTSNVQWNQGLVDGAPYTFTLQAYENQASTPTQQALCNATAHAGITVYAVCDPLAPIPGPKPPPPPKAKP